MTKNIVVCFDGTSNTFGRENTSVVRLSQIVDRNPERQWLYYDPGVGTLPEPGAWSSLAQWLSTLGGLAFGGGIFWKVQEAYTFLMEAWQPGDRVFLFGFSRGAYTARLLAAVLHQCGLLARGNVNLVPYMIRLFKALPPDGSDEDGRAIKGYQALCDEFRWSFSRVTPDDVDGRRFHTHFMGLWDTVSSVGWVWDPPAYPCTARNPSVHTIRHAVSIDERRWFFRQNLVYKARRDHDVVEAWFPGVHADVGGGYPEADGGLWRVPFQWMTREAEACGLLVDGGRREKVLTRSVASKSPCCDAKHESLTLRWWPAELFPKLQWRQTLRRRVPAIGLGRRRRIKDGALIHACALTRLRFDRTYQPGNLSPEFRDVVLSLANVPDMLAYAAKPSTGTPVEPAALGG